jgi:putative transposase
MPDHLHLLITVGSDMTIERAMQLIKGGFSYWLKKEFGFAGEVWQRGFSEVRVNDRESFLRHREYIAQNPVKAGLANSSDEFRYCYSYLARQRAAGAKAQQELPLTARLKSCPDTKLAVQRRRISSLVGLKASSRDN